MIICHPSIYCVIEYMIKKFRLYNTRWIQSHREANTKLHMGKTALQILNKSPPTMAENYSQMKKLLKTLSNESFMEALPKMSDVTMVVVILIATMAFRGAISPQGGIWQDNTSSHRGGEAVLATTHPKVLVYYFLFLICVDYQKYL